VHRTTCAAPSPKTIRHDPQARRLQLEADDEEQQYDAELRDLADVGEVVEEAQAPRPDDEPGRYIAEDGAQVQESEQRHCQDGGAEQNGGLGE